MYADVAVPIPKVVVVRHPQTQRWRPGGMYNKHVAALTTMYTYMYVVDIHIYVDIYVDIDYHI